MEPTMFDTPKPATQQTVAQIGGDAPKGGFLATPDGAVILLDHGSEIVVPAESEPPAAR
jgi:hypothetical protein